MFLKIFQTFLSKRNVLFSLHVPVSGPVSPFVFFLSFVSCLSCGLLLILKEDFNTLFNFHQNSLKESSPDVGRAISGYFMTDCSRPRPQMSVCFSVIDFDRNTPKALFPRFLPELCFFFYCTDPDITQNTVWGKKNKKNKH